MRYLNFSYFKRSRRFFGAISIMLMILLSGQIPGSADRASLPKATREQSEANITANIVGNCTTPFNQEIRFPVGQATIDIEAGDFNGDNRPDLAVLNIDTESRVSILLNNGNGNFSAPINYPIALAVTDLTLIDFNSDNLLDVVVDSTSNDSFEGSLTTVLENDGSGNFVIKQRFNNSAYSRAIAAGDFNNDGWIDIASGNNDKRLIDVRVANDTGGVALVIPYFILIKNEGMVTGDFNGDGRLDLSATGTEIEDWAVTLLGDPFLLGPVMVSVVGPKPNSIATGDFNRDGKLDLFTGNEYSYSILLGTGDGRFNITSVETSNRLSSVITQDFNGDGNLDIAGVSPDDSFVVMFGDGTGKFNTATNFIKFAGCPVKVAAADFNGDGAIDLAVGNGSCSNDVTILTNSCAALTCPTISISTTLLPNGSVGIPYQQSLAVTGGSAPYSFNIKSGRLPSGFLLNKNGTINGTPTLESLGNYNITIVARDANGCAVGERSFTLTIALPPPPIINSFTPNAVAEASNVAINGDNFINVQTVKFNGLDAVFTVKSNKLIIAKVPTGVTTGSITITALGGTATSVNNFSLVLANAPSISSFTPTSGLTGTAVTINGSNLSFITSVKFNGIEADYTINADNRITAIVPVAASTGTISVANPVGTTMIGTIYTVRPKITGFSPNGERVNRVVTITGSGLANTTSVKINNVDAPIINKFPVELRVSVPESATTGKITVITPAGSVISNTVLSVIKQPLITSFTPASGSAGTIVTINGSNFDAIQSVDFNGIKPISFTVVSNRMIRATLPLPAQTGKLHITNRAGTATSATDFKVLPAITNFTPTSGIAGQIVTINGRNLSGTTAVRFNNVTAAFTVDSDSQISATVPATAATGLISITTPSGVVNSSTAFTVTKPPTITSFTPTSAAIGTKITINGTNLTGITEVTFNGVSAPFTSVSAASLTTTVPANATSGRIKIANVAGIATSAIDFKVLPKITTFSPTAGIAGDPVIITGASFTGATSVKFGTLTASFTIDSDSQITAIVPTNATTARISVITAGGTALSATNFTIIRAPFISSFTPISGAVGTVVTINGNNFIGVNSVKFNGTSAINFTIVSTTSIRATVPSGATTGKINIANRAGNVTSTGTFTVTN